MGEEVLAALREATRSGKPVRVPALYPTLAPGRISRSESAWIGQSLVGLSKSGLAHRHEVAGKLVWIAGQPVAPGCGPGPPGGPWVTPRLEVFLDASACWLVPRVISLSRAVESHGLMLFAQGANLNRRSRQYALVRFNERAARSAAV
jgi:hypothetical protein